MNKNDIMIRLRTLEMHNSQLKQKCNDLHNMNLALCDEIDRISRAYEQLYNETKGDKKNETENKH